MRLYLHNILLSLLICCLTGPALHAYHNSAAPVKSDINQAQISDGNFKFPEIIASVPAVVASTTLPTASAVVEIPVQEIPAIDNLLQIATQSQPKINRLATPTTPADTQADQTSVPAISGHENTASGSFSLKPGLNQEPKEMPVVASASAAAAGENASATFYDIASGAPAPASAGMALTASETAEAKGKKDSEYIDTLFPDPLSPDFPSESGISDAEKNRPAREVIDEINQKAEEIAERTARELGIEYIPPSERLPKTEPGELAASASGELGSATPEVDSGETKVVTEDDSGSWEYPGDTRASAAAEIKKPQTDRADSKDQSNAVKENEITEEPETTTAPEIKPAKTSGSTSSTKPATPGKTTEKGKPAAPAGAAEHGESAEPGKLPVPAEKVKTGKLTESTETVEAGTASGSENTGEKAAVDESVLASETVVTDAENEIIPVQWPDSPEDPEFATGSQQLFTEQTASATISSGELPGLFEKAEALTPALMTRGKPEDDESETSEVKKITGRLVPEKQPLGRRRYLYRWVLKTDDGRRIPLKSNLKLLTQVRNEKMLDGKVNLTGRFVKSGMNEELQYFVVESATFADASTASGTTDIKTKPSGAAKKSTGKKGRQPAGTKNATQKSVKTNTEADKIDSAHKSGSPGTKNAAKKQDLPSGDLNLKKAPMSEQP